MSIIKNFRNPWEDDNWVLQTDVLDTSVLDNNVLNDFTSDNEEDYEIANEKINIGKGNLILIFSRWMTDKYNRRYKESYLKENFEKGNKMWDYIVVPQQLGAALDWVKKYKKKYPDIPFHNVIIITHGVKGQLNIAQPRGSGSWLYGTDVNDYKDGKIGSTTYKGKAMDLLKYLGENMYEGGNILFFACSGGQADAKLGSVASSLGKFYHDEGKIINMFFNKDQSKLYSKGPASPRSIPWEGGLSGNINTGWRFVQSTVDEDNKIKTADLKSDLALYKDSDFGNAPYPDVIRPH